jgi:glycosyltransferase involved in cell wall biosynthesis
MTHLDVSLITTVFNERKSIEGFLESIANQSCLPAEIVIVDGGSSDGTPEFIKAYQEHSSLNIVLISQACNISQGRNLAIAAASCDIILVTDAGCILGKEWVNHMVQPFITHSDVDVVGGSFVIAGVTPIQKAFAVVGYKDQPKNNPSSRSFAFRKQCWLAYPYPENLKVHEDTVLCNKWRELGFTFYHEKRASVQWLAEKRLGAIYRKYKNYTKWWVMSGDRLDKFRQVILGVYALFILAVLVSPLLGILLLLGYLSLRILRQVVRSKSKITFFEFLFCFPVTLSMDVAVIVGVLEGFIEKGRVSYG